MFLTTFFLAFNKSNNPRTLHWRDCVNVCALVFSSHFYRCQGRNSISLILYTHTHKKRQDNIDILQFEGFIRTKSSCALFYFALPLFFLSLSLTLVFLLCFDGKKCFDKGKQCERIEDESECEMFISKFIMRMSAK